MTFTIVGMYFRSPAEQYALETAPVGTPVVLVPEPTNRFDANAVKVMIGESHVGYVPRTMTREVIAIYDKTKTAVLDGCNSVQVLYNSIKPQANKVATGSRQNSEGVSYAPPPIP